MALKHTPGPWEFSRETITADPEGVVYVAELEQETQGRYRGPVCQLQSCDHIRGITAGEAQANAHLIRRAPEMYRLLCVINFMCCYEFAKASRLIGADMAKEISDLLSNMERDV